MTRYQIEDGAVMQPIPNGVTEGQAKRLGYRLAVDGRLGETVWFARNSRQRAAITEALLERGATVRVSGWSTAGEWVEIAVEYRR